MRCPFCSNQDSQVKDSRPTEDNTAIRRRRICEQCGSRFTTFERIQLRDLVVVKSKGQKENWYDTDKEIQISIYSCIGQLILEKQIRGLSNIDISFLAPSYYLINVQRNGLSEWRKIVKK